LDTNVAVQITANAGWRNGAANDAAPGAFLSVALLISGSADQNALHANMSPARHFDKSAYCAAQASFLCAPSRHADFGWAVNRLRCYHRPKFKLGVL
jgi:hypothetical protein